MLWFLAWIALLGGAAWLGLVLWHAVMLRRADAPPPAPVSLILPLTGDQPGLADLFHALAAQGFRPRRLLVAVESPHDPAAAQARAMAHLLPFPLEVVVAGEAAHCAQKNHNLLAGLARLDAEDAAVVLLDGDIRPQPWWLGMLVGPVLDGRFDAVTGYRWLMPGAGGPLVQAVAWLDHGVAILPKATWLPAVWGGSLCLGAAALQRLDLPALWSRHISDDLSLGRRLREAGLRVLTRRALLVPVPAQGRGLGFYRRQFQYGRLYLPGLYAAALALTALATAGIMALLLLALGGSGWAGALLLALLGQRLAVWALHQHLGRRLDMPDPPAARWRQLAMALLPPFACLAALGAMLGALRVRRLEWRGIGYALDGPDRVKVVRRDPWEAPPPCPITGAGGSVRLSVIPTTTLCALWKRAIDAQPTPIRPRERITLWRSPCGLLFSHPMIPGDGAFYAAAYGRWEVGAVQRRHGGDRVEFDAALSHIPPGAAVLELGAGSGSFAQRMPDGVRYTGLEPYGGSYDALPDGIRGEFLEDHAATHQDAYDVACAFQVIEHLADPLETARRLLSCVKPGGLLILAAPLWPSAITRIPNFVLNLPPHHLTNWNPDAFRALAGAIGAEVVRAEPLPATGIEGIVHWMARLSPIRARDGGSIFEPRWSWHLALGVAHALARIAQRWRELPPGAAPMNVMLVARRPAG